MGKESTIQWTDATWNPHYGCHRISQGCKYCYMMRDTQKYGIDGNIVQKSKTKFNEPLRWKDSKKIFTCSWSDFFIEEADEWRDEMWEIIKATPHHTYQILTKRPERIKQCLPSDWGTGYENAWLGVTVENQKSVNRCDILGGIPSKVRFISAEPLIEEVDFTATFKKYKFHWCIIGGESGNNTGKFLYRQCNISWIEKIIRDCQKKKIAVFVKQLGTHLSKELELTDRHGGDSKEWPQLIQICEFPKK